MENIGKKRERLRKWIETLPHDKLLGVSAECIYLLIHTGHIDFPEDAATPRWEVSGENIDKHIRK